MFVRKYVEWQCKKSKWRNAVAGRTVGIVAQPESHQATDWEFNLIEETSYNKCLMEKHAKYYVNSLF